MTLISILNGVFHCVTSSEFGNVQCLELFEGVASPEINDELRDTFYKIYAIVLDRLTEMKQ